MYKKVFLYAMYTLIDALYCINSARTCNCKSYYCILYYILYVYMHAYVYTYI